MAIARMLLQNAPVMVFDDSLSAVDAETDAKIRSSRCMRVDLPEPVPPKMAKVDPQGMVKDTSFSTSCPS